MSDKHTIGRFLTSFGMTNYFIFWRGEGRAALSGILLNQHYLSWAARPSPTSYLQIPVIPNVAQRSEESPSILERLIFLTFLSVLLLFGLHNRSTAANRYSVASGNWNSTATWSATSGGAAGASVPVAGDAVFVEGFTVTLNVNGECASLTVGASGGTPILNIGAFILTVSGNVVLNGTRNVIVRMTSSSSVLTIGGNLTLGPNVGSRTFTLDMSNGVNNASTLNIAGSMTRNIDGVFTPGTASTVNYNGTAAQTINLTQFTYAHLNSNNTEVTTGATLGAAITATNITGNISVNSGLFRTNNLAMAMANSRTLTIALGATMNAGTTSILMGTTATVTINGTFITANTSGFSGTAATAIRSTNTPTINIGANSIIEYDAAAAQTVTNRTDYANVTLTGGSKTIGTAASQTVTLSKNLTINTGATYNGTTQNPILFVRGDFINGGTFNQGTETVTFDGTAAQTISGTSATTFTNNVTLSNAAGLIITTSPTINVSLTFTNGKITTGANKVIFGSAAITAGMAAGRYIYGNQEIFIPNAAAPSRTFIVGDATNYTPVLIVFAGTTTGSGSLIVSTTAGDDADIDNSGINSALSVNRTWTVTQGAVPVGGFTSYSGTFTFVAGDIDGGANTANFVVRKNDGTWATTTTGTRTATSTQATGMATFGTYQVGEARTITVATNPSNATICAGSDTTFSSTSTSIPAPTIQWQRGNPGYTNIIAALDAPNTTYSDFTTSTLTLTGSETAINGYLYRAVFTNINGTATSTAATLTVNASPTITAQPSNQTVCLSVNANFTVATSAGSPSYQWQMSADGASWVNTADGTPAGVTYTNATTATLTANGTSVVSLYYYRCVITAGGCFRNSNSATLIINTVPAAAGNITGTSTVCQGQTGIAYSVGAISGATSYTWAFSGTGATFSSNPSAAPNITIDFSPTATSGNLTVKGTNGCGNGTTSSDFSITVLAGSLPAAAGAITGTSAVCPGVSYTYSVAPIAGASSYTWAYSGTGMIISGNTASVTGTFIAGATTGNLTVRGTNACGSGPVSPDFAITFAVCVPHNQCNGCHIFHDAPGGAITAVGGNANLCISCHNPAGFASAKPFNDANKAVPGVSGNSHAWDRDIVNATYETNIPDDPQASQEDSMRLRLPGNQIICSTCHNQHGSAAASPFLRVSNVGNAMCKDCHDARNRGIYSSDPVNNRGTHPVGVVYPVADSRFNAAPTDSVLVVGGNMECTSCHKQHYAPFNTGYILRAVNSAALCTKCHTYTSHQGMDCKRCHQPHNTDKANIYMIRNSIQIPDLTWKTVVFTAETGANSFADGDATYNGVCEVCHTATQGSKHFNTGAGDHAHNAGKKCVDCHLHNYNSTSFTGCTTCHTNNLPEFATDAHTKHTKGLYTFPCSTCHYQRGIGTSYHENAVKDINFDPAGMARRNGLDANTPSYNPATKVCTNVYCHSNGYTAHRGSGTYGATLYEWDAAIAGSVTYVATPNWATGNFANCQGACHGGPVSFPPSPNYYVNSSSPAAQLVNGTADVPATDNHDHNMLGNNQCPTVTWPGSNYAQCFWCHNTNGVACNSATNYQGTYGTSFHVDGQTHFIPFKIDGSGSTGNIGTFAIFNNRANDTGSDAHCAAPGGGKTCW